MKRVQKKKTERLKKEDLGSGKGEEKSDSSVLVPVINS